MLMRWRSMTFETLSPASAKGESDLPYRPPAAPANTGRSRRVHFSALSVSLGISQHGRLVLALYHGLTSRKPFLHLFYLYRFFYNFFHDFLYENTYSRSCARNYLREPAQLCARVASTMWETHKCVGVLDQETQLRGSDSYQWVFVYVV